MGMKRWKKITAGALSICMLATCAPYLAEEVGLLSSPVTVHAETGDIILTGNCQDNWNNTWNYNYTTKVLMISGTGTVSNPFADPNANVSNFAEKEVKKIVFSDRITEIDEGAFYGFTALEEIQFGGVKKIGNYAFGGCTSLKTLNLDENLKEIGEGAFQDCKNLTTVTVGPKVQTVYGNIFKGCDNLTSIKINKGNKNLYTDGKELLNYKISGTFGDNTKYSYNSKTKTLTVGGSGKIESFATFNDRLCDSVVKERMKTLIIGDKITAIGTYAFRECTSLKTVKLGKNVKTVGSYAFATCKALETVTLGAQTKTIGERAFRGCAKLNKINSLTNLTQIKRYSFSGCKKLKTFSIGKSVKSIGEGAFSGCTSLTKFSVHKSNKYFSTRDNMLLNKSQSKIVSACFGSNKTCNIYGSVKDIDKNILNESGVKSFSVSSKNSKYAAKDGLLYSKNGKTLLKCPSAMSGVVNMGDSVTKIASKAFENCNNITQLNIGKNVQTISDPMYISAKKLNKIQVSDKNEYYYETNGSLISKADDELIYCYKIDGDTYTIPDSVKKLATCAFSTQTNLKKVIFPNSVEMNMSAFRTADHRSYIAIESIQLGKDYKNPTNDFATFSWLSHLKEITVSNENPNYTSVDGVLYDKDMKELKFLPPATETYMIPESVTGIDISYSESLKNLNISDTITDATLWLLCCRAEAIHIGKNISTLINDYFFDPSILSKLKYISADEENSTFKTVNNMLYSKDGSKFILCPAQTEGKVVLEAGVTEISKYAFSGCNKITEIVIPDTVSKIENYAFDCSAYMIIWVPKGKKDYYQSLFTAKTGYTDHMFILESEN